MENNSLGNISEIIKRVRKELKLSQREFAERLDINIKTVQNWEYKYSLPSRSNIQRVIEEFELKKEDYPELFTYVAAPRSTEQPRIAKEEENALSKGAPSEKDDEKKNFFKKFFNIPAKVALFSVLVLFAIIGLFFIIYISYIGYIDRNIVIALICIIIAIIIITFAVYSILKRRKK